MRVMLSVESGRYSPGPGTVKLLEDGSYQEIRPPVASCSLIRPDFLAMATGSNYFTCGSVAFGLMVMSYFGSVAERCRRASISFISLAGTRTPSGYTPWRRLTVGCSPFQVIRRTHCRTTFRQVRSTPFHFFSNADQHRSIGLYLLWYGG